MSKPITDMKFRIKEALEYRRMTQQELSSKTGIPKASISQYISGYTKPKQDRISMIATALDVDPAWLMGFDVPMKNKIPVYEAAAGEGRYSDGSPVDMVNLSLREDEYIVTVVGDSMSPTLVDGDQVVIRPQNYLSGSGRIYLVTINGDESTLKRVRKQDDGLVLIGDNINVYAPHFYTRKQVIELPVRITGIVVKLIREL